MSKDFLLYHRPHSKQEQKGFALGFLWQGCCCSGWCGALSKAHPPFGGVFWGVGAQPAFIWNQIFPVRVQRSSWCSFLSLAHVSRQTEGSFSNSPGTPQICSDFCFQPWADELPGTVCISGQVTKHLMPFHCSKPGTQRFV